MPMRCCHFGDHRVGEIADLVLRIEQHRHQRRAPHRILLHQRIEAGRQLGRKDAHGLGLVSGTHRINSRAHASAAISISSSPRARARRNRPASVNSSIPLRPSSRCPHHLRAVAFQIEPRIPMTHRNLFFAQLDRRLPIPIQPMRRGVAAEQGSKRNPKFHVQLCRFRHQRSISPSTMSIDPITATTSASMRPLHIVSSACRLANPGYRMCTRYGFAVPSETT